MLIKSWGLLRSNLYSNNLGNLEKIDKFLDICEQLSLSEENVNNQSWFLTVTESGLPNSTRF